MTSKASRSRRSARNSPRATMAGKVDIGRSHYADICCQHFFPAKALELPVFDHTQQFFLYRARSCGDLIEEDRATIGKFEPACAPLGCAGKGPAFMSKKFAVQQFGRQGSAVHFYERAFPAFRQKVHSLADQFLTRAAFTNDQNGPLKRGDAADMLQRSQPGRTFTNQLGRGARLQHIVNIAES